MAVDHLLAFDEFERDRIDAVADILVCEMRSSDDVPQVPTAPHHSAYSTPYLDFIIDRSLGLS
jgi:hypothetical protein